MNCRRVEQLLSDHLEGLLSKRDAGAVAAHLGNCPTCHRLRDEILAAGSDLRTLVEPPPHAELRRRTLARWRSECAAPTPNGRRGFLALAPAPFGRRASLAAAAGAVLVALLGLAWWPHGKSSAPSAFPSEPQAPRERITSVLPSTQPLRADRTGRGIAPEQTIPAGATSPSRPASGQPRAGLTTTRRGGHRSLPLGLQAATSLGDDLARLNGEVRHDTRRWVPLPADSWGKTEARVRRLAQARDDFVQIPFPRLADASGRQMAAAVESYQREAATIDPRLAQGVTLQQKATALSDLCERLRADTGIHLSAGASVADEKVTLFCEQMPLRAVMRQLSRPFGYTWLRSGKMGEYRYELVQDLRSQLLEEELRNRDRNAALIALDQEMQRYRPYLSLSPEEAQARAKTAAPTEKWLLDRYANQGWGPVQMYFRLSPQELAALRTGQQLLFSQEPRPDERPLPRDLARGVLQSLGFMRFRVPYDGSGPGDARSIPDGLPPAAIPEASGKVTLALNKSDLGQVALRGGTRIAIRPRAEGDFGRYFDPIGVGVNPAVRNPQNATANARLAHDPALRPLVAIRPEASCRASAAEGAVEPKATTADALAALHRSTGLPIVADYYTRLYLPSEVSVAKMRLFDALNQLADTMRLRWSKEGNWLQFRSASYYDDRLKEVPNRLLTRWSASRKQHGALPLEDLLEIAQLADTQLDAGSMAEGAKICFGLAEWDLARNGYPRPHIRYLAGLTPAQRQQAQGAAGLAFAQMSLSQQQGFIGLAFGPHTDGLQSLGDLAGASLQADYSPPGRFEWATWKWPPSPRWLAFRRPPVRERTREAALEAARQIDPQVDATQITSAEPAIRILYNSGPNPRLRPGGVLATADSTFDLTISRVSQ
jgi:hypothetical protein